ncbi:MAG TPA: hypothetical protein VE715_20385 [Blastocatellia bacterium]|nr:hypothetical protein [Blastocatellia bacterium]
MLDQTPDAPAPVRERIAELEAKHQPTHGCIGCDPCYPVAISNTLYAISDGASVENFRPIKFDVGQNEAGCGTSCGYEAPQEIAKPASVAPRPKIAWPIETGDYRLGSDDGYVAIATLASEDLYHQFSGTTYGDCAICGKVFTENIGIEKVVKNIIANRHIRFLILCGQEVICSCPHPDCNGAAAFRHHQHQSDGAAKVATCSGRHARRLSDWFALLTRHPSLCDSGFSFDTFLRRRSRQCFLWLKPSFHLWRGYWRSALCYWFKHRSCIVTPPGGALVVNNKSHKRSNSYRLGLLSALESIGER